MIADMDKVFKALAHPARRLLLDRLLTQDGQSPGRLFENLYISRQAALTHLQILEQASLVRLLRHGRAKLYCLNPAPIHELAERWIAPFERDRLRLLAELKEKLEGEN